MRPRHVSSLIKRRRKLLIKIKRQSCPKKEKQSQPKGLFLSAHRPGSKWVARKIWRLQPSLGCLHL